MSKVNLVSSDGASVGVEREVAEMSRLVKEMLVDDDDDEVANIPLPNINGKALAKVVEYCTYHVHNPAAEIEKPLKSKVMTEIVGQWDAKFIDDVDQEMLFSIILAANYLDIPCLLDLACAKVASMIKGCSAEEIRRTFNIVNDFTPEEEAQVRAENKWIEEGMT